MADGINRQPSGLGVALSGLLEGTDPAELIGQIAKTFPSLFTRLARIAGSIEPSAAEGSTPQESEPGAKAAKNAEPVV